MVLLRRDQAVNPEKSAGPAIPNQELHLHYQLQVDRHSAVALTGCPCSIR